MLGRIIMSRGAGRRWQQHQQQQQRAAAGARSRDAATRRCRRHSAAELTNDGRSAATRSRGQTD